MHIYKHKVVTDIFLDKALVSLLAVFFNCSLIDDISLFGLYFNKITYQLTCTYLHSIIQRNSSSASCISNLKSSLFMHISDNFYVQIKKEQKKHYLPQNSSQLGLKDVILCELCWQYASRISSQGGAQLKKLRRAEVFRVKNRDFTTKNHIFSNFRGGECRVRPPLDPPLVRVRLLSDG